MFGEQLNEITQIVYRPELNFEQLAALQPDVILAGIFGNYDPGFDQMAVIAPTVTYRYSVGETYVIVPWRDVLRQNGRQFAREAAAEAWIARFEQRAAELRSRLAPRFAGATYAMVEPYGGEFWRWYVEGGAKWEPDIRYLR